MAKAKVNIETLMGEKTVKAAQTRVKGSKGKKAVEEVAAPAPKASKATVPKKKAVLIIDDAVAPKGKKAAEAPAPKGKKVAEAPAPKGKKVEEAPAPKGKKVEEAPAPKRTQKEQIVELADKGKTKQEIHEITSIPMANIAWYFSKLKLAATQKSRKKA